MLTHVIYDLIALRGWTFRHQTEAGCCTRVSLTQKLRTAPDSLFSPFVAIGQLRHRVTGQQSTSVCSTNRPQATSGQTTSNSNWCNSSAGSDLRITSRNVARPDSAREAVGGFAITENIYAWCLSYWPRRPAARRPPRRRLSYL